jgi:ribonuclease E
VAEYLNNRKRRDINRIEDECRVSVEIRARADVSPNHIQFDCEDENGNHVRIPAADYSQSDS